MVALSITTTRAFIKSYFWPLWMPSTCGWMLAPMDPVLMPRFSICYLCSGIVDDTLDVPDAEPLPGDDRDMPYFLIGDDAFSLRTWLMKPFSARGLPDEERIFNYRLSRARRVVENVFGIMANRFGCLLTTMSQNPETVTSIVLACCMLHNIMRLRYPGAG